MSAKVAVGRYRNVRAILVVGNTSYVSPTALTQIQVVRAKAVKAVTVSAKRFRKGTKPKVTVRVGRLTNGRLATGKVQVRVGKKVVRTVKLTAKRKGKITVTLPKRYTKSVKVRARYVPTSTKNATVTKWSRVKTVAAK